MTLQTHFQKYRLKLEPISPIHVGSGETIEPYEYDLLQRDDLGVLVALNLNQLFSELTEPQRAQYDRIIGRDDFPALRRWLRETADPERHRRFRVAVVKQVANQIGAHLDDPRRMGEIHLLTRDAASGRPILPGSSIKGAIRTAVVDAFARREEAPRHELERFVAEARRERRPGPQMAAAQRFEAAALGNLTEGHGRPRADLNRDPLRQLALSDVGLPDDATYIDRIQIINRGSAPGADPSGIVIYRELTRCHVLGESPAFTGELRLFPWLSDSRLMRNKQDRDVSLPQRLDVETLCRWCNAFYRPRLEEETRQFVGNATVSERLLEYTECAGPRECLIRLGRHSHFECVTVGEPFRIEPSKGFGKSRSYASGIVEEGLPLGWAKLTFELEGRSP